MTEKPPASEANADAGSPAPDEPDGRAYHVSLPMFEGPLDLLLHLIQKHELNILDIPIGFIAKKYVEYIGMLEELSIDLASEYLVMAATLAHIKSRSLLPPDPTQEAEDDTLEEEEDPRAELIRRLLEYQKYKHAADSLGGRELLGRDVFGRGLATEPSAEEAPLAPLSLFKLIDAFEGVLKRAKQVEEHHVNFERVSISERIGQIVARLRLRGSLQFEQLFDGDVSRADMIVTFLALLEMTKLRLTHLTQEGPLQPITVELALGPNERHEFEDELDERVVSSEESLFSGDDPPEPKSELDDLDEMVATSEALTVDNDEPDRESELDDLDDTGALGEALTVDNDEPEPESELDDLDDTGALGEALTVDGGDGGLPEDELDAAGAPSEESGGGRPTNIRADQDVVGLRQSGQEVRNGSDSSRVEVINDVPTSEHPMFSDHFEDVPLDNGANAPQERKEVDQRAQGEAASGEPTNADLASDDEDVPLTGD